MTAPGPGEVPYEVTALLNRALPSMVHVEVLVLLSKSPSRAWTWHDAAAEVHSSPATVAAALEDLVAARLVEPVTGSEPVAHRFGATEPAVLHAVESLREMYERRPVTLIRAVYERPSSSVQAFADAFRVRPKGDGR